MISLSLDASRADLHDDFRRVPGSFDYTIRGWKAAQEVGLRLQINTTVTRYNLFDLPKIFALVREQGAMTWSVFFLVPTGRGLPEDEISPADYEAVLNFLYDASKYIGLKTTEGHHYKRVVLQRTVLEAGGHAVAEHMALNETYLRLQEGLHASRPAQNRRCTPIACGAHPCMSIRPKASSLSRCPRRCLSERLSPSKRGQRARKGARRHIPRKPVVSDAA